MESSDVKDMTQLFTVSEFVIDHCHGIAWCVRGGVAGVQFDDIHRYIVCMYMISTVHNRLGEYQTAT